MALFPLDIPPGMFRNGTEYQSSGRWYDAQGIRWFSKTIRPVGGWAELFPAQPMSGPGRGMLAWRRNNGASYVAVGTPDNLYVFTLDALSDITPAFFGGGVLDTVSGTGFGSGRFGEGLFGGSGGGGSRTAATQWSLATWGEDLLAMASHDNALYLWEGSVVTPAALVADAPTGTSMFVTEEEIAVIVGAGDDQRTVNWCHVRDLTQWTSTPDNLAGDHKIKTDGVLLMGLPVRGGNLILSTVDAYTMRYVGPNKVYEFERAHTSCGLVGLRAAATYGAGMAAWMSDGKFFTFDGATVRELPCDVLDYIFADINLAQISKVYAATNSRFGELTWFYPSAGSTRNDRSVTWNYLENHWAINGQPARTAWQDAGTFPTPFATDYDGGIFTHETGWLNDGEARVGTLFLRCGPIEIGAGDQVIYLTKVLPDEVTSGAWSIQFSTRFSPENPEWNYGPYTLTPFTDVRFGGRQVAIQITNARDEDARVGKFRFEGKQGGKR